MADPLHAIRSPVSARGLELSAGTRDALAGAILTTISLVLLVAVSRATGPSFDELARLSAIENAQSLVLSLAHDGLPALGNWTSVGDASENQAGLLVLLGAWAKLSIGRVGLLDPLTSARLPWIVLCALAPLFLYLSVRRSWGGKSALLAGILLLLMPRWLHGAALGSAAATLASLSLLVLACYLGTLCPGTRRGPLFWSVATGAAIGFAAAVELAALWVVGALVVHYWLARFHALRRLLRRGLLPAPGGVVAAALFVPLLFVAFNPPLWGRPIIAIVEVVLRPLAPSFEPAFFGGQWVSSPPVPKSFVMTWLFWTLPAAFVLCLAIGAAVLVHRGLARRFASGNLRPRRDRAALGALLGVFLTFSVIFPGLAPRVLSRFPPYAELSLPFVAMAAAVGLAFAAERAVGLRRAPVFYGAVILLLGWIGMRAPSTLSASCGALLGGAAAVQERRLLPLGDGSELASMAPALDALGRHEIVVVARDVPPAYWSALRELGRLHTAIASGPAEAADFVLVRGQTTERDVVAAVERDGARLWTLLRQPSSQRRAAAVF